VPDSNAKVTGDFSSLINGAENAAKSIAKIGTQLTGIAAASKAFDVATSAIGGTVNALGKIGMAAMGIEAIGKSRRHGEHPAQRQRRPGNDHH
jgi:hypothetical protein